MLIRFQWNIEKLRQESYWDPGLSSTSTLCSMIMKYKKYVQKRYKKGIRYHKEEKQHI